MKWNKTTDGLDDVDVILWMESFQQSLLPAETVFPREGQIWEAAMAASFLKVDNLVAIVDYNQIQLDGFVKDIMSLEPLAEKWRSFGWHVIEAFGHDIAALQNAFGEASSMQGKPTCILAHTVKGKGVSFMENNPKFHGSAPTRDECARALQELA